MPTIKSNPALGVQKLIKYLISKATSDSGIKEEDVDGIQILTNYDYANIVIKNEELPKIHRVDIELATAEDYLGELKVLSSFRNIDITNKRRSLYKSINHFRGKEYRVTVSLGKEPGTDIIKVHF